MWSEPPTSDSIVSASPRVIGWLLKFAVPLAAAADLAAVAEDEVLARAGYDRVHVLAAEDDVVAAARRDVVLAAIMGLRAEDPVDVRSIRVVARQRPSRRGRRVGVHPARVRRRPVDVARVAEDEVSPVVAARLAVVGHDDVAADPAEDEVAPHAGRDVVQTADERLDRLHEPECDRLAAEVRGPARRRGDLAAVAEDEVLALPATIVSMSSPPRTMSSPPPVVMSSWPPLSGSVLKIRSMSEASVSSPGSVPPAGVVASAYTRPASAAVQST